MSLKGATMNAKRRTGLLGEQLASEALMRRGYEIIERGWRCPNGEVDIVARDGECWVFVEVKTRHGRAAGLPDEAFTRRKAERLTQLAQTYLSEHSLGMVDWRLDLVAIELDAQDSVRRLEIVPRVGID
jgi:putative endonuclease